MEIRKVERFRELTGDRELPGGRMLFARNFLKHPRMLGSVIPSSRFLIGKLLAPVDWSSTRVVVEYGPGVGTISTEVLARMRSDARLVVFETNADFVELLRSKIRDPRLIVLHRSAHEVLEALSELGLPRADYIISGIPFSTMPETVRTSIVQATAAALRPGGAFLVYQFSPKVRATLERSFAHVGRAFEPLNIPPATLFFCRTAEA
jgi:phospholipid N-methyltransferase